MNWRHNIYIIILVLVLSCQRSSNRYSFLIPIHKTLSEYPINNWKDSLGTKYPTNKYEGILRINLKDCDSIYYYCELPNSSEISLFLDKKGQDSYAESFLKHEGAQNNIINNDKKSLFIFFYKGKSIFEVKSSIIEGMRIGSGYPIRIINNECYSFEGVNYMKGRNIINDIIKISHVTCNEP